MYGHLWQLDHLTKDKGFRELELKHFPSFCLGLSYILQSLTKKDPLCQ